MSSQINCKLQIVTGNAFLLTLDFVWTKVLLERFKTIPKAWDVVVVGKGLMVSSVVENFLGVEL